MLDRHKGVRQTRCNVRVPPQPVGQTDRPVAGTQRAATSQTAQPPIGGSGTLSHFFPPAG